MPHEQPELPAQAALRHSVSLWFWCWCRRWPNLSFPVTTWQRDLPTTGRRKGQSQDPGATPRTPPPSKPLSSPGSCLKSEWGPGRSTFWRRWIMGDSSLDWTGSLMSGIRMITRLRVAGKVPESTWDLSMMGKDSGIEGLKVNVEIHIFILSYASLSPVGFNCFSNIFISLIWVHKPPNGFNPDKICPKPSLLLQTYLLMGVNSEGNQICLWIIGSQMRFKYIQQEICILIFLISPQIYLSFIALCLGIKYKGG